MARHVNVLVDPHAVPIIVGGVLVRHSIRYDAKRTFAQVTNTCSLNGMNFINVILRINTAIEII